MLALRIRPLLGLWLVAILRVRFGLNLLLTRIYNGLGLILRQTRSRSLFRHTLALLIDLFYLHVFIIHVLVGRTLVCFLDLLAGSDLAGTLSNRLLCSLLVNLLWLRYLLTGAIGRLFFLLFLLIDLLFEFFVR